MQGWSVLDRESGLDGQDNESKPVLLSEEADFETWLTGSPEAAFGLIRTYDAERMRIVQSGAEKQDLLGAAEVSVKS